MQRDNHKTHNSFSQKTYSRHGSNNDKITVVNALLGAKAFIPIEQSSAKLASSELLRECVLTRGGGTGTPSVS